MSEGRAYDWNEGEIPEPKEGSEFTLLEPGEYTFRVHHYERGNFPGTDKTPACYKAILFLDIAGVTVKDDMILHSNFDWKMCQFFKAIGDRKSGEALRMNWDKIAGKTGRCKIKHRADKKKPDIAYNEVDRYIDPADAPTTAPAPAPSAAPADGFPWEGDNPGW